LNRVSIDLFPLQFPRSVARFGPRPPTRFLSWRRSMVGLLGTISFVGTSQPVKAGPTGHRSDGRSLPERLPRELHSVAVLLEIRPAGSVLAPGADGPLLSADRGKAADSAVAWVHRLRRRHGVPGREYRRAEGVRDRGGRPAPGGQHDSQATDPGSAGTDPERLPAAEAAPSTFVKSLGSRINQSRPAWGPCARGPRTISRCARSRRATSRSPMPWASAGSGTASSARWRRSSPAGPMERPRFPCSDRSAGAGVIDD
jgi:hypothetical protein